MSDVCFWKSHEQGVDVYLPCLLAAHRQEDFPRRRQAEARQGRRFPA